MGCCSPCTWSIPIILYMPAPYTRTMATLSVSLSLLISGASTLTSVPGSIHYEQCHSLHCRVQAAQKEKCGEIQVFIRITKTIVCVYMILIHWYTWHRIMIGRVYCVQSVVFHNHDFCARCFTIFHIMWAERWLAYFSYSFSLQSWPSTDDTCTSGNIKRWYIAVVELLNYVKLGCAGKCTCIRYMYICTCILYRLSVLHNCLPPVPQGSVVLLACLQLCKSWQLVGCILLYPHSPWTCLLCQILSQV